MNPQPANLEVLLDVPVNLSVELGACQMPMRDVLQLQVGSVVQLEKLADTPVDLLVNRKLVARGQVVVIDDRFGLKVLELVNGGGK
ncbi:MAG TPA: flagellar motor switch protein FliN [Candidatus Limnocylindria bacterium]|nr:flagellar motor switch protein FliN [Candidatus Limnocylindria bacterium]